MPECQRICVLGAGVIGLHTATRLKQDFPAAHVTIIAAGQGHDTTSFGAGGIFRPGSFNAARPEMTREIVEESWRYYREMLASDQAAAAGVCEVSGYFFTQGPESLVSNSMLKRLCADYRSVTDRELAICPGDWKNGVFCTTIVADSTYQLKWLTQRFTKAGGNIVEKKVQNLSEIKGFDIIVNCTGIGATELTGDRRLIPVRGQVFKVKAPWIKTFFYAGESTYVIPGVDHVTLGGNRQFGARSTEVDEDDAKVIWQRCVRLVPSLSRAEIVRQWVGLRPHRDPVRIEKQRLDTGTTVIHCYGHGGYGVTTAPGSAGQVSRMVAEVNRGDFSNPVFSNL